MNTNGTGIFVSGAAFLADLPGGVQQCTREYIATLQAAGLELHFCPCEPDRGVTTRAIKKLWRSNYFRPAEPRLVERIVTMAKHNSAKFVFLNQVNLASISAELRTLLPSDCRIVVLSHGLESTDLLHALRLKDELSFTLPRYFFAKQLLGDSLLREASYRRNVDLVLCLSPFDVELERWLGARRAAWLPRTISAAPLKWNPHGDRVGFVGTLDHPPNIEGLLLFLPSITAKAGSAGVRIRVVGEPSRVGQRLSDEFAAVDYLGGLADGALMEEASTWNCFVHPIFCQPRGCSTKLATAIGWGLPIVTTSAGRRGYEWRRGSISIVDSLDELSDRCLQMMDPQFAEHARAQVSEVAQSSPTIREMGCRLVSLLEMD